jgi:hypothetical protein
MHYYFNPEYCKWRIRALWNKANGFATVSVLYSKHTCFYKQRPSYNLAASIQLLMDEVPKSLTIEYNTDLGSIKDIVQRQFGIELKEQQLRKLRDRLTGTVYLNATEDFARLPSYIEYLHTEGVPPLYEHFMQPLTTELTTTGPNDEFLYIFIGPYTI